MFKRSHFLNKSKHFNEICCTCSYNNSKFPQRIVFFIDTPCGLRILASGTVLLQVIAFVLID